MITLRQGSKLHNLGGLEMIKSKRTSRLISLLVALMLVLGLMAGCAPKDDNAKDPGDDNGEVVIEPEDDTEEEDDTDSEINLVRDATGETGVVATAKPEASAAGIEIMKAGGNAIDAAVAAAFALGVAEPNASGIGGGGFMMIRFAETGEEVFLDFREVGPENSKDDMYAMEDGSVLGDKKRQSEMSVAVPGEVDGLLLALEKFGTLDREQILAPAIDLAENGFEVTENYANMISDTYDKINTYEATADIFLNNGLPYEVGDMMKNPDLANTLRIIAKEGRDGFYKGEVAEDIVKTLSDPEMLAELRELGHGVTDQPLITMDDLANYKTEIREPVRGTYRGYEIVSSPPSSSGGTHVVQILNMLENYDMKELGHNSAESIHLWSETTRRAFKDRSKYMADPNFIDVPLDGLLSKEYAKKLIETIEMDKPSEDIEAGDPSEYESASTTHLSVMDSEGNMVAITKTINHFFGSGVSVPGRGIILNNIMSSFSASPGKINSVAPGKRPLSSMAPTFVLKDGEAFMTLGSPGSTRIIPTVAQIISNVIDYDMDVQEALNAARTFDSNGKAIELEDRIDQKVIDELKAMGHEVEVRGSYDEYFGGAQCIIMEDSGIIHGAGDPRRDGEAMGY